MIFTKKGASRKMIRLNRTESKSAIRQLKTEPPVEVEAAWNDRLRQANMGSNSTPQNWHTMTNTPRIST